MELVVDDDRGIEPVLRERFRRDRPIHAPALAVQDALDGVENVALGQELRLGADHLRGDVEDERRLVPIRRGTVDLAAGFAVEHEEVDRERRRDFGLPVLAREHQQARPVLPAAVLPGREQRLDDAHLPGPQVERLAGERALGVRQAVDDGERVGRLAYVSTPAHLLTGVSSAFGTLMRGRLTGVRPKES